MSSQEVINNRPPEPELGMAASLPSIVTYAGVKAVEEIVELDEPYQINVPPIEPSRSKRSGYFAEAPAYYQ